MSKATDTVPTLPACECCGEPNATAVFGYATLCEECADAASEKAREDAEEERAADLAEDREFWGGR